MTKKDLTKKDLLFEMVDYIEDNWYEFINRLEKEKGYQKCGKEVDNFFDKFKKEYEIINKEK